MHNGPELDLLVMKDGRRLGIEVKRADAPRLERSMRVAIEDLQLDRLIVLYPGGVRYALEQGVEAVPLADLGRRRPRLFARRPRARPPGHRETIRHE